MPAYDLEAFMTCCIDEPDRIILHKGVLESANRDFGIATKKYLLDFIGNNGLENINFINTKRWMEFAAKGINIDVDAYEFSTMNRLGYIAFCYNRDKWNIKSFHLSSERNPAMEIALRNAGLIGVIL
jgi:hypothetical protein